MSKKRKAKAKRAARKLPAHMQDVAFTKRTGTAERQYRNRRLGKFGPASEVRKIDPSEYRIDGQN